jgi:hypothetical protein
MASRQGFVLRKSPRRDPRAVDYEGWMITSAETGDVVVGDEPRAYSLSIDDVETYLTQGDLELARNSAGTRQERP